MASPAMVIPNGLPEPSHHDIDMEDAPAYPTTTIKRKREPSINGVATSPSLKHSLAANGVSHPTADDLSAIRDYLLVLERYVSELAPALLLL